MTEVKKKQSYLLSRWLFLRLMGAVYFVAFLSYAVQVLMLNGENGIQPIHEFLEMVRTTYGADAYLALPGIFWFNSSDSFILGSCILGTFLSILVMLGILTGPSLIVLTIIWMSLVTSCREFTGFQSDGLLIEATVLTLFMVPWCLCERPLRPALASLKEPSVMSLLLIRFLLFRLMFAAGMVKILSEDATWRDLTALSYHQETQPIPSPMAWFVHHFPVVCHQLSAISTFFIELVLPPMYFLGRRWRLIAALGTVGLHSAIAFTGNYTFLNMLSAVLCVPLLDDEMIENFNPWRKKVSLRQLILKVEEPAVQPATSPSAGGVVVTVLASIILTLACAQFFKGLLGSSILPPIIGDGLTLCSPFRLFNSYGMFAVMTTTRPEIVFEGSLDGKQWKEYQFKYKAGDLFRAPPIVAPHMPRLDWRLWFAAMEPVSENPWVLNIPRLLLKGDPTILSAFRENPFGGEHPRYMRAYVYDYHFTDWKDLSSKGQWWRRDNKRNYFDEVELSPEGQLRPARL